MTWPIALLAIIGALLLLTLALTVFFFRLALCRNDKQTPEAMLGRMKKTTPPEQFALIQRGHESFMAAPKQDIFITSRDGLGLHAYLFEQPEDKETKGTIILVHGWRGHPEVDFSASWERYRDFGFRILAIHQRGHAPSDGRYITFGVKERFDLIDWANFVNQTYGADQKIVISGISMGCATVLMALGESELPENVVGATADCGFVSAWDEFTHVLKTSYHLPKFPLLYTADLMARAVAGFHFRECTTEQALRKARIPVLFIHGLADDFVPPEHTRRSAAACASPHELIEVEGAGHGVSYLVDTDHINTRLDQFFRRVLNGK